MSLNLHRGLNGYEAGGEEKVYRCKETLDSDFIISDSYLKERKRYFYKKSDNYIIPNDSDLNKFFILEHIGSHDNEDKENKYIGLFNDTKLFPEIIKTLNSAIVNDHEVAGSAIKKIPQFFWITHRLLPEFITNPPDFYLKIKKEHESEDIEDLKKKVKEIKERSVIFIISNTLRNNGVHSD